MNAGLVKKCIFEGAILFAACATGLFAFSIFRVWVVSEIDSARFKQIIDLLPKEWERFSAVDFQWLTSYMGRTASTFSESPIVLLVSLWAIVRASDVVSGEVNRGTMEFILAQPVSRWNVYVIHSAITAVGLGTLVLIVWAGMALAVEFTTLHESVYPEVKIPISGIKLPITFVAPRETTVAMRDVVNAFQFGPGALNLFCVGAFLAGVTAMISAFDRFRWRTLGIAAAVFILSAMLKIAAMSAVSLDWLSYGSFLALYEPELHIKLGQQSIWSYSRIFSADSTGVGTHTTLFGPMGANVVLVGLGAITWFIGGVYFKRRDIPPPL